MAKVNISNVVVLDNPSPFLNPFQFEITFECLEDLPEGKWEYAFFPPLVFVLIVTEFFSYIYNIWISCELND